VPTATAADLLNLTSETVLKNYRDLLVPLDGRKFGLKLGDVLGVKRKGKRR